MTETSVGKVLVTGGAGFIGCALSQQLAERAEQWVVFDNLHPQVHPQHARPADLHGSSELVVGDVTSAADWSSLLDSFVPDVIVHLAAETGTAQSLNEASRHAEVNVLGTTRMLDALGAIGHVPAQFVLSSSRAVYGEGEWAADGGAPFTPGQRSHAQLESAEWDFAGARPVPSTVAGTWPAPTSIYGATKLAQEHLLSAWSASHDTSLAILRFQNVYGPGQSLINSYTGIVSLFSQLARDGKSIPIYEDGNIVRDFVYIDDVARSIATVVATPPSSALTRYDVGSGVGTTILELASHIADYYGAPAPHITGAYRDGDIRHAETDVAPTTAGIGWAPQWSVEDGLAALQKWIAEQA